MAPPKLSSLEWQFLILINALRCELLKRQQCAEDDEDSGDADGRCDDERKREEDAANVDYSLLHIPKKFPTSV